MAIEIKRFLLPRLHLLTNGTARCAILLSPRRGGVGKWIPLGEGYLLALVGCHWERQ
jgi:hypothetical protein